MSEASEEQWREFLGRLVEIQGEVIAACEDLGMPTDQSEPGFLQTRAASWTASHITGLFDALESGDLRGAVQRAWSAGSQFGLFQGLRHRSPTEVFQHGQSRLEAPYADIGHKQVAAGQKKKGKGKKGTDDDTELERAVEDWHRRFPGRSWTWVCQQVADDFGIQSVRTVQKRARRADWRQADGGP